MPFLAQAMSCSKRAHGFPASRASLVMSCPTVYNTFWCFPIALMSLLRMHDDATDKELLARPSSVVEWKSKSRKSEI